MKSVFLTFAILITFIIEIIEPSTPFVRGDVSVHSISGLSKISVSQDNDHSDPIDSKKSTDGGTYEDLVVMNAVVESLFLDSAFMPACRQESLYKFTYSPTHVKNLDKPPII